MCMPLCIKDQVIFWYMAKKIGAGGKNSKFSYLWTMSNTELFKSM